MNNEQRFSGEWETKQLKELGLFSKGRGIKRDDVTDEGVPCIRYGELYTRYKDYILKVASRIPLEVAETALPIKTGDLLFAGSGETAEEIGRCAAYLGKEQAYAGGDVIVLTPSGQNSIFLGHLMNSPIVAAQKARLGQGDAVVHIYINNLAQVEIELPPITEQRAIAEVLSDVDGLINALDALIAKKCAIKQATMQQLLTGKTRLPGFRGGWETKRLGEIGNISGAGVDKKVNSNEEPVRLVNYLDVYNKTFLYSKDLTHQVSARPDQVRHCVVEKGDIFFTPSSEVPDDIGCSAVAMENISDGVYSYHVVRLRLKTDWDLFFRAYIFNTKEFLDQASKQCEGSGTRYVISLPKFRAMTVRFPPTIEEQHAIAAVLSDMDAEIAALEQRRDKTRAIKQAMMQQLLTGRVRLSESRICTDDAD